MNELEKSVAFYRTLFDQEPTKTQPAYAKFEVAEPPVNLSLNEVGGDNGPNNSVAHFGIQVKSTEAVKLGQMPAPACRSEAGSSPCLCGGLIASG